MQIKCDNESAIKLASNPIFQGWTKHIEVCHHYTWDKVMNQETQLKGVSTTDQVEDVSTKAFGKPKLNPSRLLLGSIIVTIH